MRFYRRKDIFDLHPLYGLHFFLLKFQVFDLHRFLIDEDMALFMVFKDLSAKFALIAPVVDSHKPQLFRFRCDPKLFLQLSQRRFQVVLSRRDMSGAGDVITACEGILFPAPLL